MSIVLHLIAETAPQAIARLKSAVKAEARWFRQAPGFESAEVLVNHADARVQFLMQFASFEEALAFTKERFNDLRAKFADIVNDTSPPLYFAVESQIGALPPATP